MSVMIGIQHQVGDTLAITKRNLIRYIRLPQLVFFSSIQPVMFLLLFNYVFGGAIGPDTPIPGGEYINFLLPGILVQTMLFGALQTGIGLAEDMGKGIIDRFRSLPMSRGAVMAGRTFSDMLRNLTVAFIMISVGSLLGFRFMNGWEDAILMVVLLLLFGFSFSWASAFMGMSVKDSETAQVAGFAFIFPLTFASSAFVPVDTMPGWLQAFANNQPVTHAVNAARYLALGVGSSSEVWITLLWTVGILAVFIPLAVWRYRKS